MTDMIDRIADCLVEDHIKLMHENKALRDQIEIMNKEFDKYLDAVIKAERTRLFEIVRKKKVAATTEWAKLFGVEDF
ncbi:MAG: hypothetical protein EB060_12395 [Proteobacteria bacterium]|nr:hypothetical protein [Pseudomonadota bacterium]